MFVVFNTKFDKKTKCSIKGIINFTIDTRLYISDELYNYESLFVSNTIIIDNRLKRVKNIRIVLLKYFNATKTTRIFRIIEKPMGRRKLIKV